VTWETQFRPTTRVRARPAESRAARLLSVVRELLLVSLFSAQRAKYPLMRGRLMKRLA
jgi:hypothetical protein